MATMKKPARKRMGTADTMARGKSKRSAGNATSGRPASMTKAGANRQELRARVMKTYGDNQKLRDAPKNAILGLGVGYKSRAKKSAAIGAAKGAERFQFLYGPTTGAPRQPARSKAYKLPARKSARTRKS